MADLSVASQYPEDVSSVLDSRVFSVDFADLNPAVLLLARQLAASAVQRDREGGSALAEKELIRSSGLLGLSVPRQFGGRETPWPAIYAITRYLAAVDSSLAHLFAFHHLQVGTILLFGDAWQQRYWLGRTIEESWFWGNATNGRDTGLQLVRKDEHYELNGSKSFCSGALGADALVVSAPRSARADDRVFALVPGRRDGLLVKEDWDGFGQRQTDSGTVHFESVFVDSRDLLEAGPGAPRGTLRTCLSQLILVQIYLGNAQGALSAALDYTREQTRAWPASGVSKATDDPFMQQRYGDLWLRFRSAQLLADEAAQLLQKAWENPAVTAAQRGEVALAIAQAKVVSARAALAITAQIFEAMGARATSASYGFDRFWRNVRVHTLHDPLDYKVKDIGHWLLSGEPPVASVYS
ncbi:MAG: monooxygenase [Gammaproteobacteria bacterium HGW-Gammaproteobacteria-11]|nr:MAG: monooxygenase [Gammaproteobacteria bacterium HGW-Gammaproteobacteria-11]